LPPGDSPLAVKYTLLLLLLLSSSSLLLMQGGLVSVYVFFMQKGWKWANRF
jgi:hypothetical protein